MERPPDSDKLFWHRYDEFYRREWAILGPVSHVLELGILDGRSLRWLADLFPSARIAGCDVHPPPLPPDPGRIEHHTVDQGSVENLRSLFRRLDRRFDLVIDDGSHDPVHQRNSLIEALPWIRPGGIYVLEDLHTSHPRHPLRRKARGPEVGPLHLLLALEHLRAVGKDLSPPILDLLSLGPFSREDVELVHRLAGRIAVHRRAALPLRCFRCGGSDHDYAALRCACGEDLDAEADSITSAIHLKA